MFTDMCAEYRRLASEWANATRGKKHNWRVQMNEHKSKCLICKEALRIEVHRKKKKNGH